MVNDATAKMAEAYKGFTAIVEANVQQQLLAVKTRYEQEKTALELSKQSEAAQITKSTQLLTEALTQQTTLRRQATTDTLQLIEQETQAQLHAFRSADFREGINSFLEKRSPRFGRKSNGVPVREPQP